MSKSTAAPASNILEHGDVYKQQILRMEPNTDDVTLARCSTTKSYSAQRAARARKRSNSCRGGNAVFLYQSRKTDARFLGSVQTIHYILMEEPHQAPPCQRRRQIRLDCVSVPNHSAAMGRMASALSRSCTGHQSALSRRTTSRRRVVHKQHQRHQHVPRVAATPSTKWSLRKVSCCLLILPPSWTSSAGSFPARQSHPRHWSDQQHHACQAHQLLLFSGRTRSEMGQQRRRISSRRLSHVRVSRKGRTRYSRAATSVQEHNVTPSHCACPEHTTLYSCRRRRCMSPPGMPLDAIAGDQLSLDYDRGRIFAYQSTGRRQREQHSIRLPKDNKNDGKADGDKQMRDGEAPYHAQRPAAVRARHSIHHRRDHPVQPSTMTVAGRSNAEEHDVQVCAQEEATGNEQPAEADAHEESSCRQRREQGEARRNNAPALSMSCEAYGRRHPTTPACNLP